MATARQATQITVAEQALPGAWRFDVFGRWPWLKRLVRMRSFQFLVILPNLFMFYLFLIAGFWGTPVGNKNIIIVFVWILWWFLLITLLVPLGSRSWCTICPLPALLRRHHGNISAVAREAQISRKSVYELLRRFEIDSREFSAASRPSHSSSVTST